MKQNVRFFKVVVAAMILTAVHAQAQQVCPSQDVTALMKRVPVLSAATANTARKGTAIEQRLIAECAHFRIPSGGSQPYDSVRFKYSGIRGSRFASNGNLSYTYYPFDSHAAGDFNGEFGVKADSIWQFNTNGTSSFQLFGYKRIGYTVNDLISDYEEKVYLNMPVETGRRSLYVYDAGGKLSRHRTAAWEPASANWRPNDSSAKVYNATGQLLADTNYLYSSFSGSWYPNYVRAFSYNTAGYVTQESYYYLPVREFTRINYAYDAANRFTTIDYATNVNGSLRNDSRMAYTYTGSSVNYKTAISYNWDTVANVWGQMFKDERSFNTQGLVDTATTSSWNGTTNVWEKRSWNYLEYNTRNNPTAIWQYTDMQVPYYTNVRYFYYEDYNTAPSRVANTPVIPMTVYPNPVSDQLNITLKEMEGKTVTVLINDVVGRLVSSEQLSWQQATGQVSVGHLSPGTYTVNIETANGRAQQTIMKR